MFWLREQSYVATRSLQNFYGRHHEVVDCYGVSICTTRTDLFEMSQFAFPLSSNQDFTFYEQLDQWVFLEQHLTLTLPEHLVHASTLQCNPLFGLFQLFYVRCCVCLFFLSGRCPWIQLFQWFFDYSSQQIQVFTLKNDNGHAL